MDQLDWNQLKAFLETAETGSLSAAARKLGLTQPTLSRQVAAIERREGAVQGQDVDLLAVRNILLRGNCNNVSQPHAQIFSNNLRLKQKRLEKKRILLKSLSKVL